MGKRSDFPRKKLDFYPTPYETTLPLLAHLAPNTLFVEPCGGDYALAEHLERNGHICKYAADIEPKHHKVAHQDATLIHSTGATCFITNPPWAWKLLDPILSHLRSIKDTWLLLNADVMHNKRMGTHMRHCRAVVSVGRVSWEGNGKAGMENSAWMCFTPEEQVTEFYGRAA